MLYLSLITLLKLVFFLANLDRNWIVRGGLESLAQMFRLESSNRSNIVFSLSVSVPDDLSCSVIGMNG